MSDWDNREILRRLGLVLESDPEADSFPDLASDPTPAQRRALAQIAALETEHEPANDERTSFEVEEIAVALAEAMDEVRREPRTSLWRSFWDRLTEGGTAPGWPFEDEEPVHLVAAPSPTGDRERQIELIAAELRREPSRLNTIEERAEALLDALGAISSGDREREALRAAIRDVLLDTGLLTGDGQPLGEGHVLDQVIEQVEHRAADPAAVSRQDAEHMAHNARTGQRVGCDFEDLPPFKRVVVQKRTVFEPTEWVDVPASRGDQDG